MSVLALCMEMLVLEFMLRVSYWLSFLLAPSLANVNEAPTSSSRAMLTELC